MDKKLKIIALGPDVNEKGGMGSVERIILNTVSKQNIQIEHLSIWDGERSTLKLFSQSLLSFTRKLMQRKVDLVHLHIAERGSVVRNCILALTAYLFNKKVIMHMHGCEFHLFYKSLSPQLKKVVTGVFQNCTYMIVLSKSWQNFYINNCDLEPEKVIVLRNPVELPDEIPARCESKTVNFAFLGKISQRKGVYDLLEAFAQVAKNSDKNPQLLLAGNGEIEEARQMATTLGILDQVQFLGWISPAQRDELLAKADVFLLPSYNEGLPMALLEAMSWALPVITTPVGGIPEVINHQDNGWLVNPGDTQQLSLAIGSLLEDPSLRFRLGHTAREQVACQDSKGYGSQLSQLYFTAQDAPQNVKEMATAKEV